MQQALRSAFRKFIRPGNQDLSRLNGRERDLIERIRAAKLTYLSDRKLASLVDTCHQIEANNVQGDFIEAGCALGGSAILIASIKGTTRPFSIYDVFGMIPAPTQEDTQDVHERYRVIVEGKSVGIDGNPYYGYEADLYEVVQDNLKRFDVDVTAHNVTLIKGLLQETLQPVDSIAFAHIDVDWYDPVKVCLERIFPRLSVGGSIVLDDYHDWGGCRKATDEYLRGVSGQFGLDDAAGSMKVTRLR